MTWELRAVLPGFVEPIIATADLPITFYFCVDPWAIGAAGSAVRSEATLAGLLSVPAGPVGSADVHQPGGPPYGLGAWTSDGEAASDIFRADPVNSPGANILDRDENIMALLAPRCLTCHGTTPSIPMPASHGCADCHHMEDDLDAMWPDSDSELASGRRWDQPVVDYATSKPDLVMGGRLHVVTRSRPTYPALSRRV